MRTFVKIFSDHDRTITIYVGQNQQEAERIRMEDIEGLNFANFGGAKYIYQLWEDGKKIGENVKPLPKVPLRPVHTKRTMY